MTVQMTAEQMLAMITQLQAQNATQAAALAAAQSAPRRLSFKVTEKGGLSVYGLGRFPTTLYRSQWERLLSAESVTALHAFIDANHKLLAVKA